MPEPTPSPLPVFDEEALHALVRWREEVHRLRPEDLFQPSIPRCDIAILLVTDGNLDFGISDFGLRSFVTTLIPGTSYARFRITLAHREARSGVAMMEDESAIVRRIPNFRFDSADHFGPDKYDQLWMFGRSSGNAIDPSEVRAIAEFMEADKGVFATGDHASLGKGMCSQVPRVRSMRLWDSTPGVDEVSMDGYRRNDTNQRGLNIFDDQSDDEPQPIGPKLYRRRVGIWEALYPHPLLCGPDGVIDVMPDHPHEGECVEPTHLGARPTIDGKKFTEYPDATDGGLRPHPEVISTSTVLSGTRSGTKAATQGHTFGGIAAYDGHRASVGRVVTDATWHHFVNVNLVGTPGQSFPRNQGFLASSAGMAHLAKIHTYYRNLVLWICPPERIRCMNRRLLWQSIFNDRVLEAVATGDDTSVATADPVLLWGIGKQARDALGRLTGTCQTRRLALDLFKPVLPPRLAIDLDPWLPRVPERPDGPDPVPWFDPTPALDLALGAAVVAIHERFNGRDEVEEAEVDKVLDELAARGAAVGLRHARATAKAAVAQLDRLLRDEEPEAD